MNNIQALVDGLSAQWQHDRANTQMTLGKMIAALEAMPADAKVANLHSAHSYRGYYSDLAFTFDYGKTGVRPAKDLLVECKGAMDQVFDGYKGGEFVMGALTTVWVADYGFCGVRLMALHAGGEIETAEEEIR